MSKVDQLGIGFKGWTTNSRTIPDLYTSYNYTHVTEVNSSATIRQIGDRNGTTTASATGIVLVDGNRVGLKACITDGGVAESYYTRPLGALQIEHPTWVKHTGQPAALRALMPTAAGEMVPFVHFWSQEATEGDVVIHWVELEHF